MEALCKKKNLKQLKSHRFNSKSSAFFPSDFSNTYKRFKIIINDQALCSICQKKGISKLDQCFIDRISQDSLIQINSEFSD